MSKQAYSKSKGRSWENDVVAYLREHGIPAERRRLTGTQDCGDVSGWRGVVVEAKACKIINLSGWADEAETEAINAEERYGCPHYALVLAKRRGAKSVGEGYAILPPHLAIKALQALLKSEWESADNPT